MNLLFWKKKSVPSVESLPIIGSYYELSYQDGSPWPKDYGYPPIKILDAKDGWVRYAFKDSHLFSDERMELDTFNRLYKLV